MKRTIYVFCVAVCALFVMVSCSKSEDNAGNNNKNLNIPAEAKAIIPEELIGKMKANGMTINEGMNPPNIQGIFATGDLKMTYTSLGDDDGYSVGQEIPSYRYKFYDQKGTKVKTDYINEWITSTERATGRGTIISGEGNKFTAYLDVNITNGEVKSRDVSVLSGEITPEGIRNIQMGLCIVEKDDPKGELIPVGGIRVFNNESSLAVRKQNYPRD